MWEVLVFDLRGNQRTQGELSRKEGGKVFGSGSRAPVTITLLVRNPNAVESGKIYYHDIGDYLDRESKLSIVHAAIHGEPFEWDMLQPDRHGDWLEQRDDSWYRFAPIGIEKLKNLKGIFEIWSSGLKTERDVWAWNYSPDALEKNIQKTIRFYEEERIRRAESCDEKPINDFVIYDETQIKWNRELLHDCNKNRVISYSNANIVEGMYRPFCKQRLYYASELNGMTYQIPKLFPNGKQNVVIALSGGKGLSALIINCIPDLNNMSGGCQCFPLYWYEDAEENRTIRHEAISDEALDVFRKVYPGGLIGRLVKDGGPTIQKEDIFYYIYGILHSEEYRSRYEANLKKELPRIPFAEHFDLFYYAGKALADIHLNYESAPLYPLTMEWNRSPDNGQLLLEPFYNDPGPVEKLCWGKKRNPETGKMEADKSVLVYNERLTFRGIPEIAHRYVVNGRSPLEWMIDRYQVKTDPASGIVNDPNTYSDDPLYIANLVRRLVTVSVETMKIVDSLTSISEKDCYDDFPYEWKMHEQAPGTN